MANTAPEGEPRAISYAWVILGASFFVLFTTLSLRAGFGLFFKPIEAEFGWSRTALSLAVTINMLAFGIFQPVSGRLADRYGPKLVILAGVWLTTFGFAVLSLVTELWQFYLGYGVLLGIGLSLVSFVPQSALISRWFVARRQLALGIAFAGMSVGQFVMVPLTLFLILQASWRGAFLALGLGLCAVLTPLILSLVRNAPAGSQDSGQTIDLSASQALRTRPFWLLGGAFFICGASITMISVHLPGHVNDLGLDQSLAAAMLGVMGVLSATGSLGSGLVASRVPAKTVLGATYLCRAAAILLLVRASSMLDLWVFAAVFGLSWLATVPLTSGLTAATYGRTAIATIFGFISSIHTVGDALGVFIAGYLHDLTGSYTLPFSFVVGMLVVAGALSFMVDSRPRTLAREPLPVTA
jgi:MFS family permease